MSTEARQKELIKNRASASSRHAPPKTSAPLTTPIERHLVKHNSGCSCDGGCPRCQGTQRENHTGMPGELKNGLENLSGRDLSDVRVHRNSPKPAQLNALAYTQGQTIHLAPGQDKHLPHEAWHVVQQLQGRVKPGTLLINNLSINNDPKLEMEADRLGDSAKNSAFTAHQSQHPLLKSNLGDTSRQPVQREVRIDDGRKHVNEADYLPGGSLNNVGSRFTVASLIGDGVHRVFTGVNELEAYANGKTDYIGDVATAANGTFWYRLPDNQLTVLGERHNNPMGNVEDVILGLKTSRFMYEPFNELTSIPPLSPSIMFGSTPPRLQQLAAGERVASQVDWANFDPNLENIVIKAITGATLARNEFIADSPATMNAVDRQTWSGRPTNNDWSLGERTALYLSMAIHIASDLSQFNFGQELMIESNYFNSARRLMEFYLANQPDLDQFMTAKDNDELIGIYELTLPANFAVLPALENFTLVFHEYASRYIEQLGMQMGNATLEAEGRVLSGNQAATFSDMNPAREEIMWQKVQHAKSNGYLIVGMGDDHRRNLHLRFNRAGIPHEKVRQSLESQQIVIKSNWVP